MLRLWHHSRTVESTAPAQLEGTVARIVFSSADDHWTVLRLKRDDGLHGTASQTVVGVLAGVREGERLRVWGQWVDDRKYGRQFRASKYQIVLPSTLRGIERYLASGAIRGIGPKTAHLLVTTFGRETLEVIDKEPERLKSVRGLGKKRVDQIIRSWREQVGVRDVMVFLQGLGITPGLAGRIFKHYGVDAIGRVRSNPYELAQDIWGVGFLKADQIGKQLNIADDAAIRIEAGLLHVLRTARGDGHCCLPRDTLFETVENLLGVAADFDSMTAALGSLCERLLAVFETDSQRVYTAELYDAEERIAEAIVQRFSGELLMDPAALREQQVRYAEQGLGIELSGRQRDAVSAVLENRLLVITGGPGTGKTTIIRAVVAALELGRKKVALCAPTGRASKRLASATGRDARTIHRLLEWQPHEGTFGRDEHNPLDCDILIVDEVSMVDIPLFDHVLRALKEGARLLMVGDADQLPSVGPGAVLRDVIESDVIPVIHLDQIYRQASGSMIVENAHRILRGELPEAPEAGDTESDYYWIDRDDPAGIQDAIQKVITKRIPAAFGLDPGRDVQVLTPMHRGPLGTEGLNAMLNVVLNPDGEGGRFRTGDKVMQIRNNYEKEVYNGDVGFVQRVTGNGKTLIVRFDEPNTRLVTYDGDDVDQLVMAWAISIHKSQGSEYPAVIIPLHTQHYMMLRRNLLYTAVTRGRKLVVLVGSKRALRISVSDATVSRRYGGLVDRLREIRA